MRRLAVIPARGGSKRIPDKNIRPFLGKPILAYSIAAALESKLFDEVMVSTDSGRIAEIAKEYGATVPFMRTTETADDYSPLAEVLLEVVQTYRSCGSEWNLIACLLPTAPFIRREDLFEAYAHMQKVKSDAIVSISRFSYPIQRALRVNNSLLEMANPEHLLSRSQDLEPMFHDAGQFYLIKAETLIAEKSLFCANAAGFELDEMRVQDIDTESDWKLAEFKYTFLAKHA